jgi:uncharacterized protein YidB (DUF937 family)
MGLLDSVMGTISGHGSGNALLDGVLAMVNDPAHGGLEGLVNGFRDKGLGSLVDSWVSTGHNLPVSADQIAHALGPARQAGLAAKVGMSPEDLQGKLTSVLPEVVDKLTPGGQLPDAGSLLSMLGALKGR